MSYQVLARKWRPHSFADLVGQDHVRQALTNSLSTGRLHHAYLFTGTRGVGKTTIARLMAKALNCELGVSAEPCGQCGACREIDDGRFLDLLEIDAASRTKVDDTRDLLENVQYAPTRGRFKVYLIDEVHMFSKSSFNALLKTLEEPPEHVKFLLATTDPQKIPVTILSRCLQFNLRQMPTEIIERQLVKIATEEKLSFEPDALRLLARSAAGSMRDGLSLLDQAIAFSSADLTLADTASMLGTVDQGQVVEMLQALHRGDANGLLCQVDLLAARVPDYSAILEELLSLLHALSVRQQVEDAPVQVQVPAEQLTAMAAAIPAEEIQLYYQLGLHGRRDLPLAPTPRIGLEMALLRMLAFQPERSAAPVEFSSSGSAKAASRPAAIEPQTDSETKTGQQVTAVSGDSPELTPVGSGATPDVVASAVSSPAIDEHWVRDELIPPGEELPLPADLARVGRAIDGVTDGAATGDAISVPSHRILGDTETVIAAGQPPREEVDSAAPGVVDLPDWSQLAYSLSLTGLAQQLAAQLALVGVTDHQYQFTLDPSHRAVLNRSAQSRLEQALAEHAGRSIKVVIEVVRQQVETPASERQRLEQQRLDETEQKLRADPTVKALEGAFGAQLEPNSIEPLGYERPDAT